MPARARQVPEHVELLHRRPEPLHEAVRGVDAPPAAGQALHHDAIARDVPEGIHLRAGPLPADIPARNEPVPLQRPALGFREVGQRILDHPNKRDPGVAEGRPLVGQRDRLGLAQPDLHRRFVRLGVHRGFGSGKNETGTNSMRIDGSTRATTGSHVSVKRRVREHSRGASPARARSRGLSRSGRAPLISFGRDRAAEGKGCHRGLT